MAADLNALFSSLEACPQYIAQVQTYMQLGQTEGFFHLARMKQQRMEGLRAKFSGRPIQRLFLGARMQSMEYELPGVAVSCLPGDFFRAEDPQERSRKVEMLDGALVLLNNNDLSTGESRKHYADLYARCENTGFLAWDWDNHHWMDSSLFFAAHSDLFFPSHNENMYMLSRFNWVIAGPVPCGTIQWSRSFLTRHLAFMLQSERSDKPLGMHFFYPQASFRNQIVVTLKQHYDTVGFTDPAFHHRSPDDRLQEWCSHKAHFAIPVLNDVPLRIFDALVTGGIPIVPESLRFLAPVHAIPRHHICFYGPEEILDPRALVARANGLFDAGGADGLVERHRFALAWHHGEARLAEILRCAQEKLEFNPLIP